MRQPDGGRLESLLLDPWARGDEAHLIAIVPVAIIELHQ